jgi:hypothetical protein
MTDHETKNHTTKIDDLVACDTLRDQASLARGYLAHQNKPDDRKSLKNHSPSVDKWPNRPLAMMIANRVRWHGESEPYLQEQLRD